jgi:predicted kinase
MSKKVYMLIGVPGVGKSTWLANQEWAKGMPVISSDRFIDEHAERVGKTYNEVFAEYVGIATKLMENQVRVCHANNVDCIWDQTNTSAKSRKSKLAMLPGYTAVAVMFRAPDKEEHDRRLASRPGKAIPDHVLKSMMDNMQEPTEEEGFAEIWYV